jgi:hypothetical protein
MKFLATKSRRRFLSTVSSPTLSASILTITLTSPSPPPNYLVLTSISPAK